MEYRSPNADVVHRFSNLTSRWFLAGGRPFGLSELKFSGSWISPSVLHTMIQFAARFPGTTKPDPERPPQAAPAERYGLWGEVFLLYCRSDHQHLAAPESRTRPKQGPCSSQCPWANHVFRRWVPQKGSILRETGASEMWPGSVSSRAANGGRGPELYRATPKTGPLRNTSVNKKTVF